jgi:hypothetical protein
MNWNDKRFQGWSADMADSDDRRGLRTGCPHCGKTVSAGSGAAGKSVPCPACGKPVDFPAECVPVSPGAVREPPRPPKPPKPPPLTGWARQWQGVKYAAADIAFHASFIGLLVLCFRAHWGCLGPPPAGMALMTFFPAHALTFGFIIQTLGRNHHGAFIALMAPIPLSLLYTRLVVWICRKLSEKGPLQRAVMIVLLIFLLLFVSCLMIPVMA